MDLVPKKCYFSDTIVTQKCRIFSTQARILQNILFTHAIFMETLIDRLAQFIENKGISDREFQRIVGGSSGQMNAAKRGNRAFKEGKRENPASLTSIFIENILRNFPDLNPTWLLIGEGDMVKDEQSPAIDYKEVSRLRNECYTKSTRIITLMEENTTLAKEVLELRKEVDALKGNVTR